MTPIYLDYNATTPVDPTVRDAMLPFLSEQFGNPSSSHAIGVAAAEAVAAARQEVADLLQCSAEEIVFTSGGTESSNLAIRGVIDKRCGPGRGNPGGFGHLIISAIEHPATVEPVQWLERCGHEVTVIGCDHEGTIRVDEVAAAMRPNTMVVSIMHSNNEVGTIQPVREIAELCRQVGAALHVDAAQSVGKISLDVQTLGADLMTLAGHKFYAPKGVGALFVRHGVELEPLLRGGGQERGLRPGTENVAQIVGLGTAARLARELLLESSEQQRRLRDRLQAGLAAAVGSGLTVNAANVERLPNTLSVNFPSVVGAELLAAVPEVLASTGAACHSGATKRSATLAAMNVPAEIARGTVRLSLGRYTSDEEIDVAMQRLSAAWRRLASND